MVRPMPIRVGYDQYYFSSTPLAIGLFISVSVLLALCAQHSRKVPRKYTNQSSSGRKISPRSSLPSSKKIIADTSRKADDPPLMNPRRSGEESEAETIYNPEEGFGEGGLWQKAILMGEKCQPPEFSGVLFYDSYGKRISELPRSPRALQTIPVRNFSSLAQNTQ